MTAGATTTRSARDGTRLPLPALLALFTAGFLGILNETIPAGLLPTMADDLGRSESLVGQTITVYALATALTAIPLGAATRNVDRRTLLVTALATFAVGNLVIAFVDSVAVILVARVVAGVGAGLVWSNIGGVAARIVPEHLQGRAIAVAMAGIPAALSLGVPAGTVLGDAVGWQVTFGAAAVLAILLIVWMRLALPEVPGQPSGGYVRAGAVLRTRGVTTVLVAAAAYLIGHNVLFTYVGPLADRAGVGDRLGWVLLTFGVTALVGIWLTGAMLDPHHRRLVVTSSVLVGLSAVAVGFTAGHPALLFVAAAAWGLGFGGSATLFLTAGIRAAGTDGVQSILVTVFNLSIAAAGLIGGLLLTGLGVGAIPWFAAALLGAAVLVTSLGRRHAFPPWPAVPAGGHPGSG